MPPTLSCCWKALLERNAVFPRALALQAMAGIAVKGKKAGFYSEFKWFSSQPEDDVGEEIDIGGTSLFVGISFHFGGAKYCVSGNTA